MRGWGKLKPPCGAVLNANHDLANRLSLFYLFNEGGGTILENLAGSAAYNGTINALGTSTNTWWYPTPYGIGLAHDASGVNNGITFAALTSGATWSWECYIKVTATGANVYGNLLSQGSSQGFWIKGSSTTNFNLSLFYLGVDHLNTTSLSVGTWYHLACVINNNTAQFYVNGVPDGTAASVASMAFSAMLCDAGGAEQLRGIVSHERLWINRVLTQQEVQSLAVSPFDMVARPKKIRLFQIGNTYNETGAGGTVIGGTVVVSHRLAQNSLTGGLVGYWKLDDGSGLTATDSSPNVINGTLKNGPTWSGSIPPVINFTDTNSISLDGVNDYIDCGPSSIIQPTVTGSIACWINASSLPGGVTIIASTGNVNTDRNGFSVRLEGSATSKVSLELMSASGFAYQSPTTPSISTGIWYHVAATWDGTTARVYWNGVLSYSFAQSQTPTAGTNHFTIGCDAGAINRFFPGLIDDVRVYNRAITATEAAVLSAGSNTMAITAAGGTVIGASAFVPQTCIATGGTIIGGSATVQEAINITATGGTIIGGSTSIQEAINIAATGGTIIGGSVASLKTISITATGGTIIGGSASVQETVNLLATGGTIIGGSASIQTPTIFSITATGGCVIGGLSPALKPVIVFSTGGCTIGGRIASGIAEPLSGGVTCGGASEVFISFSLDCEEEFKCTRNDIGQLCIKFEPFPTEPSKVLKTISVAYLPPITICREFTKIPTTDEDRGVEIVVDNVQLIQPMFAVGARRFNLCGSTCSIPTKTPQLERVKDTPQMCALKNLVENTPDEAPVEKAPLHPKKSVPTQEEWRALKAKSRRAAPTARAL